MKHLGQIVAPGTEPFFDVASGLWYWIDAATGQEESGSQKPQMAPPGPIQPKLTVVPDVNVPPPASFETQIQNWLGKNWGLVAAGLGALILISATDSKRRR